MKNKERQLNREFAAIYARELRSSDKKRLERNLEHLEYYFQPRSIISLEDEFQRETLLVWTLLDLTGSKPHDCYQLDKLGFWPSAESLREIQCDVLVLAGQHKRVKLIFPVWKAFERVDKRVKGLRLKSRVNDLIRHAQRLLSDGSVLAKVVTKAKAGNAPAQCSLHDMVLDPQKLAELLLDDRQMVLLRCITLPLVLWTIQLGHPMAKDFGSFAEFFGTAEEHKADDRRSKTRGRVERYRLRKKNRVEKALLISRLGSALS
jgi:hypothetical protein